MICPNCKKHYDGIHIFCPFCKSKCTIKFCPKCGKICKEEDNFCTACGYELKIIGSRIKKINKDENINTEKEEIKQPHNELENENFELKQRNTQLETKNQKLIQTNQQHEEKLTETERKLNIYKQAYKEWEDENLELKQTNLQQEEELTEKERQLIIYKEAFKELETENQELKDQYKKEKEEKQMEIEKELRDLKKANKKLKTENQELKEKNTELENERKLYLENYLNSKFYDSEYDDIRKLLLDDIKSCEITNYEQINREIETYELKTYFKEKYNSEKWKNMIIIKIENREITTKEQIDEEIQRLEKEEWIKLEREELISYVDEKTSIPTVRKILIKTEIENGNITTKKQIDKMISSRNYDQTKRINDGKNYRRGYKSYMEIASDICYLEDFDRWYFDGDGISFYREATGMYESKFAHYSFDELRQYR